MDNEIGPLSVAELADRGSTQLMPEILEIRSQCLDDGGNSTRPNVDEEEADSDRSQCRNPLGQPFASRVDEPAEYVT
jgi:hypothetical protein